MDYNYKRDCIIYVVFLIFLISILIGGPIFLFNNYMSPSGANANILKSLYILLKFILIVLFFSIIIILIFV